MIASEAVPFAKTGGLADVAGALPVALARLGHHVTLALPRYRGVTAGQLAERFAVTLGRRTFDAGFVEAPMSEGAGALLIDCPELYDRPELYGVGNDDYPDNALRFAFLARAALEFTGRRGPRPDVLHAHDWQAGLAPVYLRTLYATHPVLGGVPAVFTIHNLAYQGLFPPETLPAVGLGWELFAVDGLEYWGRVSYLKGGINFSKVVTTVSKKYAKEIQTPEFGFGFDGILRQRAKDLVGILNGIDVDAWNPADDPLLPAHYSATDLSGKRVAKARLLEVMGLPSRGDVVERPLVGMISRLVDQKGFDLLAELANELPRLDATFVLLGSGDPRYEQMWTALATAHPDRIAVRIGFDDPLAHLVEAGADIFLMPSRFEPCGLNQMYSLRYGTVPVVGATGGLDDTVDNYNRRTRKGAGFKFRDGDSRALVTALRSALELYARPREWRALQVTGMQQDHSWDASAREYVKTYERAMGGAARPGRARRRR